MIKITLEDINRKSPYKECLCCYLLPTVSFFQVVSSTTRLAARFLMHSSKQPSKVPVISVVWKKLPFRSNSNRLFSLQSKRMCPNRRILFCFSYVLFRDLMMAGACPYGNHCLLIQTLYHRISLLNGSAESSP